MTIERICLVQQNPRDTYSTTVKIYHILASLVCIFLLFFMLAITNYYYSPLSIISILLVLFGIPILYFNLVLPLGQSIVKFCSRY